MRKLPSKKSKEQETIIRAVQDFWNEDKITRRVINTALWIMRRQKNVHLNAEEKNAVWYVSSNLTDKRYRESLMEGYKS